jgi:hypothetical protein
LGDLYLVEMLDLVHFCRLIHAYGNQNVINHPSLQQFSILAKQSICGRTTNKQKKRDSWRKITHLEDAAIGVLEHPQERLGLLPFDLGCATHEWMSMSSSSWFGTCVHGLEAGRAGDGY